MNDQSILLSTGGLAIGVVYLVEILKRWKRIPFITADTETMNRCVGIVVAGVSAMGIHYEWDEATRILTFAIPTTAAMLHGGWQWFIQWAFQQYIYKTGVKGAQAVEVIQTQVIPAIAPAQAGVGTTGG